MLKKKIVKKNIQKRQQRTFFGLTLGMSSEYLSTRYDASVDRHMVAANSGTTRAAKDDIIISRDWPDRQLLVRVYVAPPRPD